MLAANYEIIKKKYYIEIFCLLCSIQVTHWLLKSHYWCIQVTYAIISNCDIIYLDMIFTVSHSHTLSNM